MGSARGRRGRTASEHPTRYLGVFGPTDCGIGKRVLPVRVVGPSERVFSDQMCA
ncbi:hypothetical protein FTUN_4236 [Frigoriglobus tundricola]|uniref:Uncharacterized protein n=1 Tax=Frigoriglobus tundricola TaxID=2774151 RepID=A0A6M5YRZ9_9BACT|nr:hypothetical protein FTUN_4236 [Frigoriglobus tundricola]